MIKILIQNKFYLFFYILLFFVVFSPHFFLSKIDKKLKFGKVGSNFFLRKYSNDPELKIFLNNIYEDYKILSSNELCNKLSRETFKIQQPIKKILIERNIEDCTKVK